MNFTRDSSTEGYMNEALILQHVYGIVWPGGESEDSGHCNVSCAVHVTTDKILNLATISQWGRVKVVWSGQATRLANMHVPRVSRSLVASLEKEGKHNTIGMTAGCESMQVHLWKCHRMVVNFDTGRVFASEQVVHERLLQYVGYKRYIKYPSFSTA